MISIGFATPGTSRRERSRIGVGSDQRLRPNRLGTLRLRRRYRERCPRGKTAGARAGSSGRPGALVVARTRGCAPPSLLPMHLSCLRSMLDAIPSLARYRAHDLGDLVFRSARVEDSASGRPIAGLAMRVRDGQHADGLRCHFEHDYVREAGDQGFSKPRYVCDRRERFRRLRDCRERDAKVFLQLVSQARPLPLVPSSRFAQLGDGVFCESNRSRHVREC